jgi:hypothetical protein
MGGISIRFSFISNFKENILEINENDQLRIDLLLIEQIIIKSIDKKYQFLFKNIIAICFESQLAKLQIKTRTNTLYMF